MKTKRLAQVVIVLLLTAVLASALCLAACGLTPMPLSISATYSGGDIELGGMLDNSKLTVTVTYANGTTEQAKSFSRTDPDTTTPGEKTVTVTYKYGEITLTCTFTVNVVAPAPEVVPVSLTAVYNGGDIELGGTLDMDKVTVTVTYSNDTSKTVTDWTMSGFDSDSVGTKTVTVSYTESETTVKGTFTVRVVKPALVSIAVQYSGGDVYLLGKLDNSKISVTATYKGGSSQTVTGWTLKGFDSDSVGTKTVTVSYTENGKTATATFTVEVVKPAVVSISVRYSGGDLYQDDALDNSKISVTATYEDGSSKTVTGWTLSGFDSAETGVKTVTVTYTEDGETVTDTFTVRVLNSPLESITVHYNGGDIFVGEKIDVTEIEVTAHLENGDEYRAEGFVVDPESFDSAGTKTVTVRYTAGTITKEGSFTLQVKALVPASLEVHYNGGNIALNTQPDKKYFQVTVTYTNGTEREVTDFTVQRVDSGSVGDKECIVTYTENDTTVQDTVTVHVVEHVGPLPPQEGEYDVNVIREEELSIHFLMLGNKSTGDSVYIKAGDTDILIDAGSRANSASTIESYVKQYCTDNVLEYVVVSHAHQDHIAAFVADSANGNKGIFDRFSVETVITYARTNSTSQVYKSLDSKLSTLKKQGVNVFTANECINNTNDAQKEYTLADGITMEILDQRYYRDSNKDNENNYSVCLMIKQGENNYLFTGDLEGDGETSLVNLNPDLSKVRLWKGGHHGSYTAGSVELLKKIQPETVCICTCMGTTEYSTGEHMFPAKEFVERVSQYTDRVYCTSDGTQYSTSNACLPANGNIVFACTNEQITMYFSNNNLKLKDTEWFKTTSWFKNNSNIHESWR